MSEAISAIPVFGPVRDAIGEWGDGSFGVGDVTAGAAIGLSALDVAIDPLGSLISSGLSYLIDWLISVCDPLKQAVDFLLGDAASIDAVAQQYNNTAGQIAALGNQHADAVTSTSSWQNAGNNYREAQRAINEHYRMAVKATDTIAGQIRVIGTIVGMVRQFIISIICELLAWLIEWGLAALAAAIPSFGSSVATFCSAAVGKIGFTTAKVSTKLAGMVRKVIKICEKMGISTRMLRKIYAALMKVSPAVRRNIRGLQMGVGRQAAHGTRAAGEAAERGLDRATRGPVRPPMSDSDWGRRPYAHPAPAGSAASTGGQSADENAEANQQAEEDHHVRSI